MSFNSGDVVTVDFPGVKGIKRRPAVVLSSTIYNTNRPDVILGLITTKTAILGSTDYLLQDWQLAGLRTESMFRSFLVTLPVSTNIVVIGHLSERDWQGVCNCLKVTFADF
ncbi:MAG: type II toxin-antitoxin system PemK/MazF family toxin [Crocosphaera sp.]|nr:type II toxin-antitoxin system PemK/MazF family toxin [Crocosphaera sp.]